MLDNPTNKKVKDKITELGYDINPMKGIRGKYYTKNRILDLKALAVEIIQERLLKGLRESLLA